MARLSLPQPRGARSAHSHLRAHSHEPVDSAVIMADAHLGWALVDGASRAAER